MNYLSPNSHFILALQCAPCLKPKPAGGLKPSLNALAAAQCALM